MSGALRKMKIEAYRKLDYTEFVESFEVMFNPAGYQQSYEVEYHAVQGQGTTGSPQKFGRIKPQEYSFELVFDGTGVSSEKSDVAQDVDRFLTVTGKNNGDIHRPNYLIVRWGSLISRCVLKSATIAYSLFRPDGSPLRAKVTAVFAENIEDALRVAEEGNSSPDLTHVRQVTAGDTLSAMVHRIYGDPAYYLEVARANGLDSVRQLAVGSTVRFPPLGNADGTP
jgi:nucleoid-associated protein YgaU